MKLASRELSCWECAGTPFVTATDSCQVGGSHHDSEIKTEKVIQFTKREHTMIAYKMNSAPLHLTNEVYAHFPVRIPSPLQVSGEGYDQEIESHESTLRLYTLKNHIHVDESEMYGYKESEWSTLNEEEYEKLSDEYKEAQLDVCISISGFILEIWDVPMKVAIKSARAIVKALPHSAKMRLVHVARHYFSNPNDVGQISKGVKVTSGLFISTFGSIKNIIYTALKDLDRNDYVNIAANAAVNITLLFAGGGLALVLRTGKKTKQLYSLSHNIQKLNDAIEHQRELEALRGCNESDTSINSMDNS